VVNKDVHYAAHAVRAVGNIVSDGNTANICAIDLSKAFDKVNYFALFFKTDEKTYSQRTTYSIGAFVNRLVLTC